jgi:hypothetical protein
MMWVTIPRDSGVHVVPVADLREHEEFDCWCHAEDDEGVVIHASMDGREAFERGERLPS